MKFIATFLLLSAALLCVRFIMPSIGKKASGGINKKEGEYLLADCPNTLNCQSSEASRKAQQVERFVVTKDPSQSIATLAGIVDSVKGMNVVKYDEKYLYATATTPIMQYVDDIEFLLSDDRKSVQIRSASRLGKSDFGANKKRVDALREAATGKL